MPRRLEIDEDLFLRAEQHCPNYLSTTGFINLLIDQGLTGVGRVSAYHVGAGHQNGVASKPPLQFPPDLEVTNPPAPTEAVKAVRKKKADLVVPQSQYHHSDLIQEFWRCKKGSKSETAWTLLMTELDKHSQTIQKL